MLIENRRPRNLMLASLFVRLVFASAAWLAILWCHEDSCPVGWGGGEFESLASMGAVWVVQLLPPALAAFAVACFVTTFGRARRSVGGEPE